MVILEKLDPSHLVALHALLEERHVTRAAKRLGLTQSSMSHRLKQLRAAFADPLLVPAGGELVLSPRAERMLGPLGDALNALWTSVSDAGPFEPRRAQFRWSVALPDVLTPVLPRLVEELGLQAPRVELRVLNVPSDLTEALGQGHPMVAVAPTAFVGANIVARPLGKLRFGVACRKGHPLIKRPLTVERWLHYPHVVVRIDNGAANLISSELARRGLQRQVGLEVPSFLSALLVVAQSDFLLNSPMPLTHEVAQALELTVRPLPLPIPEPPFALVWHERFRADPAHQWTRDLLFGVIRQALSKRTIA